MAYTGSYIEEIIERAKVDITFDFYKQYNHLFSEFQFDDELIDQFEDESKEKAKEFERQTTAEFDSIRDVIHEDQDSDMETNEDVDEEKGIFSKVTDEILSEDMIKSADHDSVFMNKYREDLSIITPMSLLADAIREYEEKRQVKRSDPNDDEDSETELYLEGEDPNSLTRNATENEEDTLNTAFIHEEIDTPLSGTVDNSNREECQTEDISNAASKTADRLRKTMTKVVIAPGEFGKFVNRHEEIFLEESCFPGEFPFGIGISVSF